MAVSRRLSKSTSLRFPFTKADWSVNDEIRIIATGVPGPNELGPHKAVKPDSEFNVAIWQIIGGLKKLVEVSIMVDSATKTIFLRKVPLAQAFDGVVYLDRYIP